MNKVKKIFIYTQIILLFLLFTQPLQAIALGSKSNKDEPIKQLTTEEEAYQIITGHPKVNPLADEEDLKRIEARENAELENTGWFWQRKNKPKETKEVVEQPAQEKEVKAGWFSKKKKKDQAEPIQEEDSTQPQEPTTQYYNEPTPSKSTSPDQKMVYIKNIEITGNKLISTETLINKMGMRPGDMYSRDIVQQNLKAIYDMGYFTEKIRAIPIIHDDTSITIRISVEENIPITGFTIDGNNSVPSEEINAVLMPLLNQPQNLVVMNETLEKVHELYGSKGYILARVKSVLDDPDGVVNIEVDEGIIKSINVEGNKKTKDFVVKRNILLEEGGAYNETLLKQDLMRLYATQAFKDVTRTIEQDQDEPDKYNITIQLEEQRTGTISVGGGVDTATGLFGTASFGDNNFLGRGQRLQANFMAGTGTIMSDDSMLNRATWQAELSFFEPVLMGTDNSFLAKAFFRDFASYQIPLAIERRYGFDTIISRQFKTYKNLTGSFGLGGEQIKVKEGDAKQIADLYAANGIPISERAKQLEGGFFINLSPSLVFDTRDNIIAPRTGTVASVRFDQAVGLSDFGSTHGKLMGSLKQYIPIPHTKKAAISLAAKAGSRLYGEMPEVLAYRLGGPYSIRGFKMSAVGTGQGFVSGSAELLLPLPFIDGREKLKFLENVRFTVFADAGKIFDESITDKIYDRPLHAITTGVGLKVFIPGVGPLSIDYGFPLTNPGRNASKSGTFTFSAGDMY